MISFLAPLYLLGGLAIGLPILFHLIRRTPKNNIAFSSLLFLQETPPQLTRRSRLDNWPLLILRVLAILLLAFAFARPFLRGTQSIVSSQQGERVIVLLDTSASMRQTGLWEGAVQQAQDVLDELETSDDLALIAFDQSPRSLLTFSSDLQDGPSAVSSIASAKQTIADLQPSWMPTDMGAALMMAADMAVSRADEDDAPVQARVVLISDLQASGRLESIQGFAWPASVAVDVRTIRPQAKSNVSARVLGSIDQAAQTAAGQSQPSYRVRVSNSAVSVKSQFSIGWKNDQGNVVGLLPNQVPPGQSRVVRVPAESRSETLVITGDDHSFDNEIYVVKVSPVDVTLRYWGRSSGDLESNPRSDPRFYLDLMPLGDLTRRVTVRDLDADATDEAWKPAQTPMIVLSKPIDEDQAKAMVDYLNQGGRILITLLGEPLEGQDSSIMNSTLRMLSGSDSISVQEATVDDYSLFAQIDFDHPVFVPMSDPKYNDFSKIRFWSHRTLTGLDENWGVMAGFADRDPAIVQRNVGRGMLTVLTAGWQPTESQLGLSTKFVPILSGLFNQNRTASKLTSFALGEIDEMASWIGSSVIAPSGKSFDVETASDLRQVDEPGIYTLTLPGTESPVRYAVNLSSAESETTPASEDLLESFGIAKTDEVSQEQAAESERQLRDRELESRQRVWRKMLVAVLGLLGLETALAAWWSRSNS